MGEARSEVLRRIEVALRDHPPRPTVERRYLRAMPAGTDLVELFAERVADYRAKVVRVTSVSLGDAIAAALARRRAEVIAVPCGLPREWLTSEGVDFREDEPPLDYAELDAVDGALTGCAVAIAETGTIVMDSRLRQGRRVLSLLPDYHLCVVEERQIVGTLAEALGQLNPSLPQTWVSGPSATSDIELQRVEGVHGPRNLEVIMVSAAHT